MGSVSAIVSYFHKDIKESVAWDSLLNYCILPSCVTLGAIKAHGC